MTETNEKSLPMESADAPSQRPRTSLIRLSLWLAVMLLLAVGLGIVVAPTLPNFLGEVPAAPGQASVEQRLEALDNRVTVLEGMAKAVSAPMAQESAAVATSVAAAGDDLAKLKESFGDFSAALNLLQKELQASSEKTDAVRVHAETGWVTVLAFVRMQMAYLSGQPFARELQSLRKAIGAGSPLADDIAKLEPFAETGVPTLQILQKEWRDLAADAQAAIRKSGAQTWRDRLLVAIENLVSIRRLNDLTSEPKAYREIDKDLSEGHLAEALQKADALPPEAKEVVKDWRAKTKAREEANRLISDMADRLVEKAETSASDPVPPVMPGSTETEKEVP